MAPGLRDEAVMCRGHRIADVVSPRFATSSAVASREAPNTSAPIVEHHLRQRGWEPHFELRYAAGDLDRLARTAVCLRWRGATLGLLSPYLLRPARSTGGLAWTVPLPAREPAPLEVLSGVRDAACSPLLEVRNIAARRAMCFEYTSVRGPGRPVLLADHCHLGLGQLHAGTSKHQAGAGELCRCNNTARSTSFLAWAGRRS